MKLDKVWVYHLQVEGKKSRAANALEGGSMEVTEEIRSIFESAFLGTEKRSPTRQPFHFNFGGKIRSNSMRDHLLTILDTDVGQADACCQKLALDLQQLIDDRVGDLLFTVGAGREPERRRCALWVYPNDRPIRFFSKQGRPMVEELRRAFSRRSTYRKAAFFEGPSVATRNDFLRGEIVDATRQGKAQSVAQYWVERFLHGYIELKPARGVFYLAKGMKLAQKNALTAEEKISVAAAYSHLLSGALKNTTLSQFSNMLVGSAKEAYLSSIPTTIERDAVFQPDLAEIRRKISRLVLILENKIEVIFPTDDSIDSSDFLIQKEGKQILRLEFPVESRRYD